VTDARSCPELTAQSLHLPPPRSRVVIAVSGGMDSMVLWHVLQQLPNYFLIIYHLHHGLRAEADQDVALIRARAQYYHLPNERLVLEYADIPTLSKQWGCAFELAARRYRYERLSIIAAQHQCAYVVTAHHRDDQSETVLANILRGAHTMGQAGMPIARELTPGIYLQRPLLSCARQMVHNYAAANAIPWLEDATNNDTAYQRNYLRHAVLPALEHGVPGISEALAELAERAQREIQQCDEKTQAVWDNCQADFIPTISLMDLPETVRFHLWRRLLQALDLPIQRTWLQRMDYLANGAVGKRLVIKNVHFMRKTAGVAWVVVSLLTDTTSVIIPFTGTATRGNDHISAASVEKPWLIPHDNTAILIDRQQINGQLVWRLPHDNEQFYPLGLSGKQSVRKFLAARHVPSIMRDRIAVVADNDGIIWLPRYGIAQRVAITDQTQEYLALSIEECPASGCPEVLRDRGALSGNDYKLKKK
jgi:tRNA(Ile)-lysidine synthase